MTSKQEELLNSVLNNVDAVVDLISDLGDEIYDLNYLLSKARAKNRRQAKAYRDLQIAYERVVLHSKDQRVRTYSYPHPGERTGRYSKLCQAAIDDALNGKRVVIYTDAGSVELAKREQ